MPAVQSFPLVAYFFTLPDTPTPPSFFGRYPILIIHNKPALERLMAMADLATLVLDIVTDGRRTEHC
jgi:hypothetical protein